MDSPQPASDVIRRKMQAQRSRDTRPELALRRLLHAKGLRYRVAYAVPGMTRRTIDIAFPRQRVAVMVDGCFWHGCEAHGPRPKNNADWWGRKLDRNRARDEQTTQHLIGLGWLVVRVWEHDIPHIGSEAVFEALASRVNVEHGTA